MQAADGGELDQLSLRTQSLGGALMQENENYSSAVDVNARGASTYLLISHTYVNSHPPPGPLVSLDPGAWMA